MKDSRPDPEDTRGAHATRRMDRQKTLVGGISVLGAAGLICKLVGVLYRIPLADMVGPEGIGVYQQVFPLYNLLLTVSSAGIPVAISRTVSHCLAKDDPFSARRVFRVALGLLAGVGLVMMLMMMGFSHRLALAAGTPDSAVGFIMIAPSLLLVCVMSAFRGYMQGKRRMTPTAVSQLIEQVGKVFVALPLAAEGMRRGGYAMGAAGALLGTSIAELVALLYMAVDWLLHRDEVWHVRRLPGVSYAGTWSLARSLVAISIPITIGASIVPLAGAVDAFMLVRIMDTMMRPGEALISYGVYSGLVLPLINVPTALAMAMAANLVPSIAAGLAREDIAHIGAESSTGLRIAAAVGFPTSVGLSILAEPILFLLFGKGGQYSAEELRLGARLLEVSSLTILLFTQVQASSGILQGLHRQKIPMYTLAAGVAVKIAVNYTLVRMPAMGIRGAPLASLMCYLVSMVPNLFFVARHARIKLSLADLVLRPGAAALVMAGALLFIKGRLVEKLQVSWTLMLATIAVAGIIYTLVAFLVGAVRRSDLPRRQRR